MEFNAQRMVDMIDFLETEVEKNHFDMRSWVKTNLKDSQKIKQALTKKSDAHHCQTAACSWGYAPLIWPEDWDYEAGDRYARIKPLNRFARIQMWDWFGISFAEVLELFEDDKAMKRNLKQQIIKLKRFLSEKGYKIVSE